MTIYFLAVILGLIFGSFLNAWIYRMEKGESVILSRSKCPHCGKVLGPFELIPIFSYIIQLGRCRGCGQKISWHYPAIELALAVIFLIIAWKQSREIPVDVCGQIFAEIGAERALRDYIFAIFLAALFIFDLKHKLVPDQVVLPAAMLAFVWNSILGINLLNLLLAASLGAGFFFLQYIFSKGRWVGEGDIRIGAMMGAMLGWPGALGAIFLAYIFGSVISIFLLSSGRVSRKSFLPFGPFLTVGTFVFLLWGDEILAWYFRLTGLAAC